MAMRKVQLYLTEEQYRILKQRAGDRGSLAQVVREMVDASKRPTEPTKDPFFRHLMSKKTGSGPSFSAEQAKRDLYKQPR